MASFTVERADLFPNGTTVKAYLAIDLHPGPGAPAGAALAEAVVASGVAKLNGLVAGTAYTAYASVSGKDCYLTFIAGESAATVGIAARVAEAPSGGNELGIAIIGPPLTLTSLYAVVEANEVELHLNHGGVLAPGTTVKIKASESTEAAPKLVAVNFTPASWGELVAIVKGVGGSPFVNLTAVLT